MERGKLPPSGYGAVMVWIPAGALPTSSATSCVIMPSRLFRKYVALFVAVVCLALLANDLFEIWFYYRDYKASLIHIQRKQAEAAADKLGYFVKEIEGHLGRTNQMALTPSTLEERELDALGLLRQVPAISEFSQLDAYGREKLRVSRIAVDAVGSNADFSTDPKFVTAMANKVYYGPVYFRSESEPYMTLALARAFGHAGVSVAEINLKFIWNLVSQVKVGQEGRAYVVDAQGRLIAHPDMSLVLQDRFVWSGPGTSCPSNRRRDAIRPAASRQGHSRSTGADHLCADPSTRLVGICRAASRRGLPTALRHDWSHDVVALGSSRAGTSWRGVPRPHGGPANPRAAGRRCPHEQRGSQPAYRNQVMSSKCLRISSTRWPESCTNREKRSFDHLIGAHHKCLRDGQPERLRRLEIYNEIEFDRLLDRNVRRFRSA
jgi:Cache domain